MTEKLAILHPEIALFITTCVVMIVGLSRSVGARRASAWITAAGTLTALGLALRSPEGFGLLPGMLAYAKAMIAGVGFLLLLVMAGAVDRGYEARLLRGETFDPIRATRGEFYAFFLFSLMGVMLCAGADDLIWLFLALELVSLPTYIMVAISSSRLRAQEAAVKYFFLGAMGAATFLYGFALLYGAAGTTSLSGIATTFAASGIGPLAYAGLILSILGVCFKIAAVPMHFYTADVYEGAATPVSAYLAFAPKTAGFLALMLIVSTVGWHDGGLPEPVRVTLWVIAALTMTVGNVLATLQTSVKRILAYSSVAHSGYMLVGLIAGPGDGGVFQNGLAAILFYLLCYGVMNVGAFAALTCIERGQNPDDPNDLETLDDLKGLCATRPLVGWAMVLSVLSLLGMPVLLGFFAKLLLFSSGIAAGEIVLVVVLGLNSAIAAFYYLRIISSAMFETPDARRDGGRLTPMRGRVLACVVSGAAVLVLPLLFGPLQRASSRAVSTGQSAAIGERPGGTQAASPEAGR
ncbi:MAG: NADH-quinone oxidoreductase subunit N [Phycisphaerales bacterium]|nr:NADH-quinone oxidoreductase subunit N [Phycisphaerales bacterium]